MIDAQVQLPDGMASLDALAADLEFSGVSHVIARSSCATLARESDKLVLGVVASAPLADDRALNIRLDEDSHEELIVGYHLDISERRMPDLAEDHDTMSGLQKLARHGHPLALTLKPGQLAGLPAFLDTHADLLILLEIITSAEETQQFPQRILREIGRRPHAHFCLSGLTHGLAGESVPRLSEALRPVFGSALEAFTPSRILHGSGWPTATAGTTYPAWLSTVDNLLHELSDDELDDIRQQNACGFYNI